MIYHTGTITTVSGSSIVTGKGTKWNSNNPLVSPGMLMLIKNGDVNYPYMIKAVNSDNELVLAEEATFSATDTTYTINLTEPNNNSDAARALVAANTYILYFLQNMDTWMGDNGVVELTLPSGKVIKLELIKALQELVKGKADLSDIDGIKEAVKDKADIKSVEEISKDLDKKFDKNNVAEELGSATDKVMSQKACSGIFALASDVEVVNNYPVGAPIPWPQATPPKGYLVCNGDTFDKVKCPKLTQVYPSGKLPDLRGEFIRGLSVGRKEVDVGRTVLSNQGDAMRNITGRIGYVRQGRNAPPVSADGAFSIDKTHSANLSGGGNDDWGVVSSFDASRVVPTANESRPRNVAFLYIVRAA